MLLALVATTTTVVVSSCGGGGGSSNGALCEQCGETDGPCQDHAFVAQGTGVRDAEPCATATSGDLNGCTQVNLICRRKSDSAQQRCYPRSATDVTNPDFDFRCDGSRPGGTAQPEPTQTLTPTPASTPFCGNGLIDSGEECDQSVGNNSCATICGGGAGELSCNADCTFNVLGCTFQPCRG